MRIVSWNIRAGGGKRAARILEQLLELQADIIGLCEYRGTAASQWLASELAQAGFSHQLTSTNREHPARNALLLASREPLVSIKTAKMPRNPERWLLARVGGPSGFSIGMMHVPNYTSPTLKYPFLGALLKMTTSWKLGPALLLGDTNCGKRLFDEEKPQGSKFRREHDWIVGMEQRGWPDAFRYLHGERREYTWYSHRNNGFRLDYAFCSPQLVAAVAGLRHVWAQDPAQPQRRDSVSDHAALVIDLDKARIPAAD